MVNESSRQSRLIIFCFILEEHSEEKKPCFICSPTFFFTVPLLEQIQSSKTCLQIFTDALLIYEKLKDPSQGISKQFRNNK